MPRHPHALQYIVTRRNRILPVPAGGNGTDPASGAPAPSGAPTPPPPPPTPPTPPTPPPTPTPPAAGPADAAEWERTRAALARANNEAATYRHRVAELEPTAERATTYRTELIRARAEAALAAAGATDAARTANLVAFDKLDLDDTNKVTGLDDEIKAVKEQWPELFGGTKRSPSHDPGGNPTPAGDQTLGKRIMAAAAGADE